MTKRVLITGVTSGIGKAMAQRALEQGSLVSGIGRDFAKLDVELASKLTLDLGRLDEVAKAAKQMAKQPAFDTLILNAGYGHFGAIEQFSAEQIEYLINTQVSAQLILLSALLPAMKRRGQGDVVIIGSEAALQGAEQGSVYCAAKFALRGMAQSLRAECARSGVRVILVNPGPVRTPFFDDLSFAPAEGEAYALDPKDVARTVFDTLALPATAVVDELQIQPLKRVFRKKP